jgi:hypothetical protein
MAQPFEIRQLAADFAKVFCADEAGSLFAVMNVIQVVVRSVALWLAWMLAAATGFSADMVLP